MKICSALLLFVLEGLASHARAEPALRLHSDNPHYFQFRGKPAILLTSGEHYGAVLNLDFDYLKYLDALAKDGLNGTRTWSGAYCEPTTAFSIANNTLAPTHGRFICPWARSDQPGYANGGNKFDLNRWDPAYFDRLKDFVSQAGKRGIIVELNLFCPFYEESMWTLSPMNVINNVNDVGRVARTNVYTLDRNEGLLSVQEAMVRKLVQELKGFDNLYFEICNEPYFGGVTLEWQHHIAGVIASTEKQLGVSHLISQNIANGKSRVEHPHSAVSILNFHYATPPDTVAENFHLNRVLGDNETGFAGTNEAPYRMEAWDFIVAGGGLFNNLDYSFTVGHEEGNFLFPASQPGSGGPTLRRQLGFLRKFIDRFDYIHMHPVPELVSRTLPPGVTAQVLAHTNEAYLIYLRSPPSKPNEQPQKIATFSDQELVLSLSLPQSSYVAEWFDTKTGTKVRREQFAHDGGPRKFAAPAFEQDIALSVFRDHGKRLGKPSGAGSSQN